MAFDKASNKSIGTFQAGSSAGRTLDCPGGMQVIHSYFTLNKIKRYEI